METLKSMLVFINMLFMGLGILVVAVGAYLTQSTELNDTYGSGITDIGTGFIVLGAFTIILGVLGCIGTKSFNRKFLLAYCAMTFVILACEAGFATFAIENSNAGTVANLCVLRNSSATPIDPSTGEVVDCEKFQENELRLGSYLLWQRLWNDAQLYHEGMATVPNPYQSKKTQFEFLSRIQESSRCCGFGWVLRKCLVVYVPLEKNKAFQVGI
jgi:hypothetical protein